MSNLLVAALFLLGTHFGISSSQLRSQLVAAVGEGGYRILYSLIAAAALVWLVLAWRAAPLLPLWNEPVLDHVPAVAMPFALLLAVCGLSQPNPTALGQKPDADAARPVHGIIRVTRHPLMWGIGLWALAHLLAMGDVASLVLFGTLALLALGGTLLLDAKRSARNEPGWGVFLQSTSNLPLLAIIERRQKLAPREIGLLRVAVALGLYLVLILIHPWLLGVSALS
jgi:uncharacterized membrane protein